MASNGTLEHAGKSENLTEAEVVARFDQLAKAGRLFYDYAFRTETAQSEKMLVEFRISKALASKPWQTTSTLDVATEPGTGPKPGSDINVNGLGVQNLNGTHELTLNMFSSYRPHLLMLTNDGYRRQWEPLDIDDFRAATQFLSNMEQDYLVFYNCRVEGGCSRVHKHLQAIPNESFNGNSWVNIDNDAVPFAYYQTKFTTPPDPEAYLKAYQAGLEAVERSLGSKTTLEDGAPPHNMIMDRERMIVVPRRAAGIDPLGANSGGMLGTIWTQSDEKVQQWKETGVSRLLGVAGTPKLL
ncbi:unnamed protein product [Clonostachys byssicola]|uniref:Uncharacterized protein n=1 Tax=Clonostachys byssicola TaxID=160290 RepID=A0A9N9U727_9HYPO|nr:unnamed protein product [Clonostachys byssicola]